MKRRKAILRNYCREWNQFIRWMPDDELARQILFSGVGNATGEFESQRWYETAIDTIAFSHDERYVQRWDEFYRHYVTTTEYAYWSVTPVS